MQKSRRPSQPIFLSEGDSRPSEASRAQDISLDAGIERFLADKRTNVKPSTYDYYAQRLNVFKPWAVSRSVTKVRAIKPAISRDYRNWRKENGASDATVHADEGVLKQLTQFCARMELITRDPLASHRRERVKQRQRRPAKGWELDRLLSAIDKSHRSNDPAYKYKGQGERQYIRARDRMILLTLIETACRTGEVLALTKADLRRDGGSLGASYIHVNKSGMAATRKNGDDHVAPVSADWWREMDTYLRLCPKKGDGDLLFPTVTGGQMPSNQWAHRFKTYCEKAGVPGITAHCIRHAVASLYAEQQGTFAAARAIGDRSLQSVERYTRQAGKEASWLKEQHSVVSPLTNFLRDTDRLPKAKRHTAYKR